MSINAEKSLLNFFNFKIDIYNAPLSKHYCEVVRLKEPDYHLIVYFTDIHFPKYIAGWQDPIIAWRTLFNKKFI